MSDISCIEFQVDTIRIGMIGLKNFGTIYGLFPNLSECNDENEDLIKSLICEDDEYKDRWICKCINFQQNKDTLYMKKECEAIGIKNSVCQELHSDALCTDSYCVNIFGKSILKTDNITKEFKLGGVCGDRKSCQLVVNIEGLKDKNLTKNVCGTAIKVDVIQKQIILLCNILGIGISVLLLSLYIFYYYQK